MPDYYQQCIAWLEKNERTDSYYVFSDGIDYCKEHMTQYGLDRIAEKVVFVDVNHGRKAFNDLHLMSLCQYLIPSLGSTFSQMARVLSARDMKVVSTSEELSSRYC